MKQSIVIVRCCLSSMMAALLIFATPGTVQAEHVFERIQRTGVFNAGAYEGAPPFGYRDAKVQLVGFSVDILREIHKKLEERLGRPIKMQFQVVTPNNRFDLVNSGAVDIECSLTTPTWERENDVDFSIPFFIGATRVMTLRTTATQLTELQGKRIGAIKDTTTLDSLKQTLKQILPDAIVVPVDDLKSGIARLDNGEIDGLAAFSARLRVMVRDKPLESKVVLLPPSREPLFYEPVACTLPQDDSDWRDFINHVLADLLKGVDEYRGTYMEIYEHWFGTDSPEGSIYFPLEQAVARKLANAAIWIK